MPTSPPGPSSPPDTEWHEYKPVPSALEVLDARFEAFVYEQSRLLGEAHRCLKGHEKHLQRQQKRLLRLEERVDELLLVRSQGLGEVEVRDDGGGVGVERQIGRFKVVEGGGAGFLASGDDDAGGEAHPARGARDAGRSDAMTDEEAWEESLGFGRATQNLANADLRPQHSYRRPLSTLAADARDAAHPSTEDTAVDVAGSGEPQDIDRKRPASGHSPAHQVLPLAVGHLSMVEMLDQLGEELMGFERERDGFWKGNGKGKGKVE